MIPKNRQIRRFLKSAVVGGKSASTKIFFRKFCLATASLSHSPACVARHRSGVRFPTPVAKQSLLRGKARLKQFSRSHLRTQKKTLLGLFFARWVGIEPTTNWLHVIPSFH